MPLPSQPPTWQERAIGALAITGTIIVGGMLLNSSPSSQKKVASPVASKNDIDKKSAPHTWHSRADQPDDSSVPESDVPDYDAQDAVLESQETCLLRNEMDACLRWGEHRVIERTEDFCLNFEGSEACQNWEDSNHDLETALRVGNCFCEGGMCDSTGKDLSLCGAVNSRRIADIADFSKEYSDALEIQNEHCIDSGMEDVGCVEDFLDRDMYYLTGFDAWEIEELKLASQKLRERCEDLQDEIIIPIECNLPDVS